MAEIGVRDEGGGCAVGYLRVRVGRTHDAVYVAHKDRADLKRAKLTMTASGLIVSAGFDLDKRG